MPDTIDYQQLAQALIAQSAGSNHAGAMNHPAYPQQRFKAVGSTPINTYGHGNGGLFSAAMERPILSAMLLPHLGLMSKLGPARPSQDENPLYGILTGVTATTGSNPTNVCDDPKTAGLAKLCTYSAPFGRFPIQTNVLDVDRAGRRTNRGEFFDYELVGNPFTNQNPLAPTIPGVAGNALLNNELGKAMFELAVTWAREFARVLYTGNTTNNTAGGGYREYFGLDRLINTGYRDAITTLVCGAADSTVRNFINTSLNAQGNLAVTTITDIYRRLKHIASQTGLAPVRWVIAMPHSMFYILSDVWPCAYMSYRCSPSSGSTNFVDSGDQVRMRDDMRGDMNNYNGQYLLIDGEKVEVVIDNAITETSIANGGFSASMYFVPMTVLGAQRVTYMEYFNYDAPNGAHELGNAMAGPDTYYTTDDGRFLWHRKPPTNFCVQMLAKTEPRLVLRTPYIAARLDNVAYYPIEHERSPFTDSAYWFDGGATTHGGAATVPSWGSPTG